MRRTGQLLVPVLVATFTLVACGRSGENAPPSAGPSPEINQSWASCQSAVQDETQLGGTADAIDLPPLDDSFTPTSAVLCQWRQEKRADDGEDLVEVEGRASEISALLSALRLPDQPKTAGACTADLPVVAWFALLDAQGRWIRPGLPTDACSKIRIEVRNAVAGLRLTDVSKRTLREMVSGVADASGCRQHSVDVVRVHTRYGEERWGTYRGDELGDGSLIRLCLYRVPKGEQRRARPTGDFERGRVLSAKQWEAIRETMRGAGSARDCATLAGRLAVLQRADNADGAVYIELDGCRRIVAAPDLGGLTLAQADEALVDLLDAAG